LPYTRIFAAFMLATLISTLFALPAQAAEPLTVVTAPVATVAAGSSFDYVTTVTNPTAGDVLGVVFTDTIDVGTITAISATGLTCVVNTPTSASCLPYDFLDANAPESIPVTVTVTAPGAGPITNTATATAAIAYTDTEITAVTPVSSLTIAKSHTGPLTPGSDVTYSLQVNNAGPSTATGVSATDTLNASLTFKSSTSGCTALLQVVTCPVPNINAAGNQTVSFIATIGASVASGTVITNVATATSPTDPTNPNTSNTDSITIGVASVDLGVAITVAPTTAAPGDNVTYTVTVTNPDTATDATNVVATDVLPAGLTAVTPPTAGPTGTTTAVNANTWTLTIPLLVKASAAATPTVVTATFDATVDNPSTVVSPITNTVTLTATQTDPVSTNNTASVDLTISGDVADLNVTTAVDDSKPKQGDSIGIYIQVANAGPADATNIVLKDVLPTGLTYESCEPSPCEQSGLRRQSSQLFSMPSVAADSAGTILLHVTVQASSGTLQNTASIVSADQADPTAANDSDSLSITIGGTSNNPGGGGTGGAGGTSGGTSGGTGGSTAFTGFTAGQLMPWFMLLASLGLVALEWARRMRLVSPIGSTYGFDPFQN
jgi:fimbrial isopeptide formation D2 family protein/uncharacterized repeat protein (TIGR01451 family)